MIRIAAWLLLLANVVFFAWHQGHLQILGFAPERTREPERLAQQIRPEAIRVLSADEAKRLEAQANKPPECYVSAPLEASKVAGLRAALPNLVGAAAWQIDTQAEPARWIAYMGKYANADAQAKKKAELRALGVNVEAVRNATLEPGISLGGGPTKADADRLLAEAVKKGVRTGKVLEEKPASQSQRLKLPAVDDVLRAKWPEIRAAGGFAQFVACKSLN
jgi:hypothetical protein